MHKLFCECKTFPKSCMKDLVSLVREKNGKADSKLIKRAFFFAKEAHKGQFRESKKPYFSHPLEVAAILANYGLNSKVVAAALLHDVLEDTDVSPAALKRLFGKEIFSLVHGVTKLDLLAKETRSHAGHGIHSDRSHVGDRSNVRDRSNQAYHENLHSLLLATTKDPRVILLKLADKLHNMRTLDFLPAGDRKRISNEALAIYVPIADKIGLEELSLELEDLAFSHSRPETFERLCRQLRPVCSAKDREISLMIAILRRKLGKASFYKMKRSAYSIFTKMRNSGKGLDELNDCVILNVLVKDKKACYSALGAIHSVFPPLPNKVKDFIATPKPSYYMVLQTTVFGPNENPVKARIATREMDAINRTGVIAYKRIYGKRLSKHLQQSLSRLGTILRNGKSERDFLRTLKADFLTLPIYVFTCKGKLIELPKKSTVLDFAFASEKNRALHLRDATVNGKKASFGKKLDSGQVVDLSFSKKRQVKKSWVRLACGFLAKDAVKKSLKGKG